MVSPPLSLTLVGLTGIRWCSCVIAGMITVILRGPLNPSTFVSWGGGGEGTVFNLSLVNPSCKHSALQKQFSVGLAAEA